MSDAERTRQRAAVAAYKARNLEAVRERDKLNKRRLRRGKGAPRLAEWKLTHCNRARMKRRRASIAEWVKSERNKPCADCGVFLPDRMQFDHRDPDSKSFTIGDKKYAKTWSQLRAEIAKCDVVCRPCHQRRTNARRWASDPERWLHRQLELNLIRWLAVALWMRAQGR